LIKREGLKTKPDLFLSVKGEVVQPETVNWFREELGAKTALWYPDDPRFFDSLVKYVAPSYDYVFTASEKALERYREIGVHKAYYLPFACEPDVHKRLNLKDEERKKYGNDVVFVGTYNPKRGKVIERLNRFNSFNLAVYGPYWKLFKRGRNFHGGVYGFEMVRVFNTAKIVLNIHVESDLAYKPNMRVFEAAGCGSFLLTDVPSGIEKLFDVDSEIVCYQDERELVELINYFLSASEEREEIALRAQKRAYKEHTYEQRLRKLLKIVA
jgi:spore maturation protein CgeB